MRVISSALTTFHKRVVPVLWAGVFAVILATSIASREPAAIVMAGVGLVVMGGLALVLLKRLVWDLADEVQDHGDYLVVRRGDEEEQVPLAMFSGVDYADTLFRPWVIPELTTEAKTDGSGTYTVVSLRTYPAGWTVVH